MTSLAKRLRRATQQLVMNRFRPRDFVALFGVADAQALALELARQDKHRGEPLYADVYGLHALRWTLLDPSRGGAALGPERRALVLTIVFDGAAGDVLNQLAEKKTAPLRRVLDHCLGFYPTSSIVEFLKRHATPSGYMFRDLGPLALDKDSEPEPDPVLAEIEDAHAAQLQFEKFYEHCSQMNPADLREAFRAQFSDEAFPFPLTEYERRQPDEEVWVRRMIDLFRKLQLSGSLKAGSEAKRGGHAKGHGLIRAKFRVLDSPYPVGLFSKPVTYDAVLRPSNMSNQVQSDALPDGRGMAVGVIIPKNQEIGGECFRPQEAQDFARQDFILLDYPVFPAPNLRRFALMLHTFTQLEGAEILIGFLTLIMSGSGGDIYRFLRSNMKLAEDPLAKQYHSTTAYLLGKHHVAKYSLEPEEKPRLLTRMRGWRSGSVASLLKERLRGGPVRMYLYVHVLQVDERFDADFVRELVEDATRDWRRLGARKVRVAVLEIGTDDPTTDERMSEAEQMRFDPWNALSEHRPLGNLNRARWAAYPASEKHRAPTAEALDPHSLLHAAQ